MCLWLISQVSILAESCWSVLIFHQTVQCLHPVPISSISNWVNTKNIASLLERKRNSSRTAQIPSVEGKWRGPPLHFGVRLYLGCWRGAIFLVDEVLFTCRYEQPCGWTGEEQHSSWRRQCALRWHCRDTQQLRGQSVPLPASGTCTHVHTHRVIANIMTQQLPPAKGAKKGW